MIGTVLCKSNAMLNRFADMSLERNIVMTHLSPSDISLVRMIYCDCVARSTRYRCGDISLERHTCISKMSQGSSDISLNYRSEVLLICAIYRRDIGEISEEQSAIFHDYRLHYFCTILYMYIHFSSLLIKENLVCYY